MKPLSFFLASCLTLLTTPAFAEHKLSIKYRPTPVDVDKPYFEHLDTSKSSLVRDAWYDSSQQYLIINLAGTNYHYCGLDESTWQAFKKSDSFGKAYNGNIKGRFDCRLNPVPPYDK